MTPAQPSGSPQRAATAVVYLVVLAAPVGFAAAMGDPISHTLAYARQAQLWWNTLLNDPSAAVDLFVQLVVDIGWLLWTPLALIVAFHMLCTLLRIPTTVLPRLLLRLTPAAAVNGVALAAASVAHAHAGTAHAAISQQAPAVELRGHGQRASHVAGVDFHAIAPGERHVVERGDTLWGIAESAYGRGQEWPEIYAANQEHPQPDGLRLNNPDLIQPGWKLTIPGNPADDPAARAVRSAPNITAVSPNANAHTPANTGTATAGTAARPGPPTADPTAPAAGPVATAGSDATQPDTANAPTPIPAANRPSPAAPFTTGWHISGGGYVGITLLSAVATACVVLRRRALRADRTANIPGVARAMSAVAGQAENAAEAGWDADLELPGAVPPPLYTPRRSEIIYGTNRDGVDEAVLDPGQLPLTVYHGPGSREAAAALAISTLAADASHRLITTTSLAHELIGAKEDDNTDPTWLSLTPDATSALQQAADAPPTTTQGTTLLITEAGDVTTPQITKALGGRNDRLALLLLGTASHVQAVSPTVVEIDQNGLPRKASGPRAAAFTDTQLHTLPRASAAEIYHVLHNAKSDQLVEPRTPSRPSTEGREPGATGRIEHDPEPADEDHLAGASVTPLAPRQHETASPLELRILGPLQIANKDGDTLVCPGYRQAQLLTYLALHSRGRTLEQITAEIWDSRNTSGANTAIHRVREFLARAIAQLASDLLTGGRDTQPIIRTEHGVYRFNPELVVADYAAFERLEAEVRREQYHVRKAELAAQALALLRGTLAEGLPEKDLEWLTSARHDIDARAAVLQSHAELLNGVSA